MRQKIIPARSDLSIRTTGSIGGNLLCSQERLNGRRRYPRPPRVVSPPCRPPYGATHFSSIRLSSYDGHQECQRLAARRARGPPWPIVATRCCCPLPAPPTCSQWPILPRHARAQDGTEQRRQWHGTAKTAAASSPSTASTSTTSPRQRALRVEIVEAAWATLCSTRSRPFDPHSTGKIAVKVINHYRDEVLKVYEA